MIIKDNFPPLILLDKWLCDYPEEAQTLKSVMGADSFAALLSWAREHWEELNAPRDDGTAEGIASNAV